jgi:uncharacterized damage-inducible protein DinB
MAETQREPVPRVDSGELDTALAFLSFARHCVLKKADGLSDEQLRRVLVDSGTSVLGLVQHLAETERYWFGYHLVGAAWDADREYCMAVSANRAVADVQRDYRAAIEDSHRAIRAVGDPEARVVIPVDGNRHTLRWVMAHITSETARHAGHADILREQLDGTTGRYRCERRGRNLIQARIAMTATSSQGENKMCTVKLSTVKATMAMRTKAMIASMMIGLHSLRVVCVLV